MQGKGQRTGEAQGTANTHDNLLNTWSEHWQNQNKNKQQWKHMRFSFKEKGKQHNTRHEWIKLWEKEDKPASVLTFLTDDQSSLITFTSARKTIMDNSYLC